MGWCLLALSLYLGQVIYKVKRAWGGAGVGSGGLMVEHRTVN